MARLIAISVQPTFKDHGGCLSDWANCDGADDDASRQIHQLIAMAAGVAAQSAYQRRHGLPIDESGGGDDRRRIFQGACKLLGYYTTAKMIEAVVDFTRCEADRLVEIHWHRIARLTRVLLVLARLDKGIAYDAEALGDISARFVACVSDAGWRADTLHAPAVY
ncbi:MAG: hypothetical protein IPK83_24225 [Planctomycetes bacterium]|nr:hypothetical protein [Planctomycetota bacterium]